MVKVISSPATFKKNFIAQHKVNFSSISFFYIFLPQIALRVTTIPSKTFQKSFNTVFPSSPLSSPLLFSLAFCSLLFRIFFFFYCVLSLEINHSLLSFSQFLLPRSGLDTERSKQQILHRKRDQRKGMIFIFQYLSRHNTVKRTEINIKIHCSGSRLFGNEYITSGIGNGSFSGKSFYNMWKDPFKFFLIQ